MTDIIRPLPASAQEFSDWKWTRIEPYYARLAEIEITARNIEAWVADWSQLASLIDERYQRLTLATTQDTADAALEATYNEFVEVIYPQYFAAEQMLKEKLLASGFQPAGFEIPMRNMRAEAAIFRPENLPLQTREQKLEKEFDKLLGSEMILWNGEERTPAQMLKVYQDPDRATRERAWHLVHDKRLENRAALNDLWQRMLENRLEMSKNAGFVLSDGTGDFRALRWQQLLRFDYTPDDAKQFGASILEVVTPVAERIYKKYQERLGLETLCPWDLQGPQGFAIATDLPGAKPLAPFKDVAALIDKTAAIFADVDPQLGAYFETMRAEQLLDLDSRKNKAPGGYCTSFETSRRPFIFMNAVGIHEDVQVLLHEAGHAFHAFEAFQLPYLQQRAVSLEFCEVASMSMEFLGAPYLNRAGGFYNDADAARARVEKLETAILYWPYMAVVDAFQHWVYENPKDAMDPNNCDGAWGTLWDKYMRGVDWSGLAPQRMTGWHRKLHIFSSPFYYIEYGMAQLGAVQVWANSLRDRKRATRDYRRALALGGTAPLPALFETAGAKFKFDAPTLQEAVDLIETTIHTLEN
ncbi:MAG: M3 family oligoendopeptidase [Anaerolineae bacterium]|nr:M3 family oligoendopeptidase [Anaerolineae bacterium]